MVGAPLSRKFGREAERVRADLAFYWLEALRVELKGTITGVCRDPKDEAIHECAERAKAEWPAHNFFLNLVAHSEPVLGDGFDDRF